MAYEALERYITSVGELKNESARSHRFAQLLQELFGQEPGFIEQYVQGIEQVVRVRQKDRLLRGKVDNLFGNSVIEFEVDLERKRTEAEQQLQRYVQLLWAQEPTEAKTPYLCIAADGILFSTYTPTLVGDSVQLKPLETIDLRALSLEEAYLWLDRILMRQEPLTPTSELIVREFGLRSHAYCTLSVRLMQAWDSLREKPHFAVLYGTWERYLRIVYGTLTVEPELFIRHTYLATLAKLMAWQRLRAEEPLSTREQLIELMMGKLFQREGILGYIEDDFFAWLARPEAQEAGLEAMRALLSLLTNYDFSRLTEDVLKSLYQELVDPVTRHDLGEYYTPDWLAHKIVQELLEPNPHRSLLDPACGSGTFLYFALVEKRRRLGETPETLQHVLQAVHGADIHPLAVIIARTNYLLGLGDLLAHRQGDLHIPVYLADTLRLPEYDTLQIAGQPTRRYLIELDGQQVYLPESFLDDPLLYNRLVDAACAFAETYRGRPYERALLSNSLPDDIDWNGIQEEFEAFQTLALTLKHFLDSERDTIWAFILKNLYKPLLLRERFDAVMGNPPWIAFRSLEPRYQEFIRRLILSNYELVKGRGELITHLEVASLFLVRAADLYLKPEGTIAFVMPHSLFRADQHDCLRRQEYRFAEHPDDTLQLTEVWDCEQVSPLFTVPCCVIWGQKLKRGERVDAGASRELPARILEGKLPDKNIPLQEAQAHLAERRTTLHLHIHQRRSYWSEDSPRQAGGSSPYRERFREGATLVPREFWFVQIPRSWLGINPKEPPIDTYAPSQRGKYKLANNKGQVEARFLYTTLLGEDVFSFGYRMPRIVALPIQPSGSKYELWDTDQLRVRGFLKMYKWMQYLESEWERQRGVKAEKLTLCERLNYSRGLTAQNPQARYLVLYPDIQRISCALVIEPQQVVQGVIQREKGVPINGFVVDSVLYYCETNDAGEAYYLAAVLNAPEIDRRLGGLRQRQQKSHPHVAKKIFDVAPIPLYDSSDATHRRLAELGEACTHRIQGAIASGELDPQQEVATLRKAVRALLAEPLRAIDRLVQDCLEGVSS
jgi:hypothetical protein